MSNDQGNVRISVSEEKLELALTKLEQRIAERLEKFATTAALEMLDARVKILELWQAGILAGQQTQRRVSDRQLAWGALAVAALGALVYMFH